MITPKSLALICIFAFFSAPVFAQRASTPDAQELSRLLLSIANSKRPYKVNRDQQDRLVALLHKSQHENFEMPDTAWNCLYPSMEVLARAAEHDTTYIRTLLKIGPAMAMNAEFSECLPCYLQRAIAANPVGFIRMLLAMKPEDVDRTINEVRWVCEIDLSTVFAETATRTTSKPIKDVASWLQIVFKNDSQ